MTPLAVFDTQISVSFQDAAPSWIYSKNIFDSALSIELNSMDPSKRNGTAWASPGPRVTRRVYEGLRPGGTIRVVDVLAADGPLSLSPDQMQQFLSLLAAGIDGQFRSGLASGATVQTSVSSFNPAVNGPLEFWTGGQATVTHTRERFPSTNLEGTPSADQNENPIGPSDASLAPTPAPPIVPGAPQLPDITGFLKVAGIVAAGGVVLWLVWPLLSTARSGTEVVAVGARAGARAVERRPNPQNEKNWCIGNYGTGPRKWHVWRRVEGIQQQLLDSRGRVRRFASSRSAQRAADVANGQLYEYVVEYYQLNPDSIGKFLRRIEISASDSKEAFNIAQKKLKKHEIMALFQGSIEHQGSSTIGFGGSYTTGEWERLRDAIGGIDAIKMDLKRKSLEVRVLSY